MNIESKMDLALQELALLRQELNTLINRKNQGIYLNAVQASEVFGLSPHTLRQYKQSHLEYSGKRTLSRQDWQKIINHHQNPNLL